MKKIQHPKDIFAEITRDYKEAYGNDLVSIILYGSGAGADYQPGTSNLNFLIILSEDAIDHLDKALGTVTRWKKKNVSVPLVMTDSYIRSSLDSYPLEFLNMKSRYECVYGKDVLKDLSFPKDDLRLQCEREIKVKTAPSTGRIPDDGRKNRPNKGSDRSIHYRVYFNFQGPLISQRPGITGDGALGCRTDCESIFLS